MWKMRWDGLLLVSLDEAPELSSKSRATDALNEGGIKRRGVCSCRLSCCGWVFSRPR